MKMTFKISIIVIATLISGIMVSINPFAFVLSTTNDTIVNQGNMHLDEEKLCNQEIQMEH
jgi:hypothetical protein